MSDFNNNYNNQTPPDNGNRPDYSYNWNGSEYNRNNGKGTGRMVAIILIVTALLAVIVISAVLADRGIGNLDKDSLNASGDVTSNTSGNSSGNNGNETSKKPDYSVPEFTPSGDSDIDLSTTLTEIYDFCAPSCCTISVSINGTPYSIGSGFVIDAENGYIATNHHVIESGDEVKVIFYDGTEYEAVVVGSDSVTDIAVLKVEAEGLVQVEFGDSNNIKVGENVVAIGTPYDMALAGTMTCGIVSGIARDIDITNDSGKVIKTMTLVQTDCSINPGNSGGPLIDMAGNVIGITSLKLVDEQFEGIGFAIPITDAIEIFQKLIAGEDIGETGIATASPQIGITVYNVEDGLYNYRMSPRCEYPQGAFISELEVNSSAYAAGLNRFDIITDFNGDKVETIDDLTNALSKYRAGEEVEITVFRFNRTLTSGESLVIKFKLDAAQ